MSSDSYYQPPDPIIFRCPVSNEMNEDCDADDHDCYDEAESAGVFDPPEREYDEDDFEPFDWNDE